MKDDAPQTELRAEALSAHGLTSAEADAVLAELAVPRAPVETWGRISRYLLRPEHPFEVHRLLFSHVMGGEGSAPPAWSPTVMEIVESNPGRLMLEKRYRSWEELHTWTVQERGSFWAEVVERLGIVFQTAPNRVLDASESVVFPRWIPGARMNISESCFQADPEQSALVSRTATGPLTETSYAELQRLSCRVARGLAGLSLKAGDAVAVDLPMNPAAVAIYLGIVSAGMTVVSIADSFAPDEISVRLRIAEAKAIFTSDVVLRAGSTLPLYEKVCAAEAPPAVVLSAGEELQVTLRDGDVPWDDFLADVEEFQPVPRDPQDTINILFSSGTTGEPKAIPWTHTTPIKCASDGWLHQDIRPGDVVAWPTSLGWMMGPWPIFATLINRGTIALYDGSPADRTFCEFVRDAGVTMLGLVPSLVRSWRETGVTEGVDWSRLRCFSSTGECSNSDDMLWLMARAGYKPVIEYCGGTEIGGAYLTGSLIQPAAPGTFTTPAAGLDLVILDEEGRPTDNGEVFLVPPSLGISRDLLNRDHDEVYYAGVPTGPNGEVLRRHGDQVERLPAGGYRAHGRVDDTMNLSGIKVSSAEIEHVLDAVPGVHETAAVAVPPPGGGPKRLVVFAVLEEGVERDLEELRAAFRMEIRLHLNPLFKVHAVQVLGALPRTASNKVMRRVLRDEAR